MDNLFENILEVILSCYILHNFCQEAGEEFDDEEILHRIISIDREYLETRQQENIVQNPAAERISLGNRAEFIKQ